MAFRRSITARTKLIYQQQRVAAPFSNIHQDDNDHENLPPNNTISKNPEISNYFHHRLFSTGNNLGTRSRILFQDQRVVIPAPCGPVFVRNMLSFGEGQAEKNELMTDMAEVLGDKAAEVAQVGSMSNEVAQVGSMAKEVAIGAADSFRWLHFST